MKLDRAMTAGQWALVVVQLIGAVLSALLVAVTFLSPDEVEDRLQGFAIAKVEEAANIAWDAAEGQLDEGGRAERLGALADRFGLDASRAQLQRETIVPALIAYALSDRCGENCGLAGIAALAVDSVLVQRIAQMQIGQVTVQDFIAERYETTVQGLIRDLRRFGLVNLVALSLMMGLVLIRDYLNWRFVALSVAVTGYTGWAAYGYVYGQNWALSILLQDWAAPGYQAAMVFVSLMFADWLFLRGFVTRLIGNIIGSFMPG